MRVERNEKVSAQFIGSIVSIERALSSVTIQKALLGSSDLLPAPYWLLHRLITLEALTSDELAPFEELLETFRDAGKTRRVKQELIFR